MVAGLRKLTPDEVRYVLIVTAVDLVSEGYDSSYGYGLVNVYCAVQLAMTVT